MIRELVEFGKTIRTQHDALKEEPLSMDLVIDSEGRFVRYDPMEKKTIWAEALLSKKGSARLLLDKCEEVLDWGKDSEKKHKLFLDKLEQYKEVASLSPVFAFYEDRDQAGVTAARQAFEQIDPKMQAGNITFRIGTNRPCESEEVRAAIIDHFETLQQQRLGASPTRCSICGSTKYPVIDRPHGMIKRVPEGQSAGCALVSYNNNAFESYGLRGNENSAICTACARNYVEAMNYLLSHGEYLEVETGKKGKVNKIYQYSNRRKISSDTVALFWTAEPTQEIDPLNDFDPVDTAEVSALFKAADNAAIAAPHILRTNMFYCCTISSAAARIAVRDWIAISLEQYKSNLTRWFEDIGINSWGKPCYPRFYQLIVATRGKSADTKAEGRMGTTLWNAALRGDSLPLFLLSAVLKRLAINQPKATAEGTNAKQSSASQTSFTPERAALIKLILNRSNKITQPMKQELDTTNNAVPYLCGRLFAIVEEVQQAAMGYNLNSSIRDRFFSAAAAMPAATFGRLLPKLTQNHLSKLRQANKGAYIALNRRLSEATAAIGAFPGKLSLIEQGQFALGYYHQAEFDRAQQPKQKTTENNE